MAPTPTLVTTSTLNKPAIKKPKHPPPHSTQTPHAVPQGPTRRFRKSSKPRRKEAEPLQVENHLQHPAVSLDAILEMREYGKRFQRREKKRHINADMNQGVGTSGAHLGKDNNNEEFNSHRPKRRPSQKRSQGQGQELGQQLDERQAPNQPQEVEDQYQVDSSSEAHSRFPAAYDDQSKPRAIPAPTPTPSSIPAPEASGHPWLHLPYYNYDTNMKSYIGGGAGILAAALILAMVSCILLRRTYQKRRERRGRFGIDGSAGRRRGANRGGSCWSCCGGRRKTNGLYGGRGLMELDDDDEAFEAEAFSMRPESSVGNVGTKGGSTVESMGKWDSGADKKYG